MTETPLPSPAVRNARLFDELAPSYDAVGVDFFGPIARGLLDLLHLQPGERVADLGCGKGAFLAPAARAVGTTGRVLGLDVAPAMVAAARAAAFDQGLTNVDVAVRDVQEPDLPPRSFDVVAASLVLFFLPAPLAALRAWRAGLRPGGRLGISTFGPTDDVWASVDDVLTRYLPPAALDARTSGRAGAFATDAGLQGLVAEAGFTDVRTTVTDLPVVFQDAEHWFAFSNSTGQRAMWALVPEAERPAVRAETARRLAAAADVTGRLRLTQQVRYTVATAP